jgi:hypothetical protein
VEKRVKARRASAEFILVKNTAGSMRMAYGESGVPYGESIHSFLLCPHWGIGVLVTILAWRFPQFWNKPDLPEADVTLRFVYPKSPVLILATRGAGNCSRSTVVRAAGFRLDREAPQGHKSFERESFPASNPTSPGHY